MIEILSPTTPFGYVWNDIRKVGEKYMANQKPAPKVQAKPSFTKPAQKPAQPVKPAGKK